MTDKFYLRQPEENPIYGWFVRTVKDFPISPGDIRCGYRHMYLTAKLEVKHSTCATNKEQFYFKTESEAIRATIDYYHGKEHNSTNDTISQNLFEDET